MFLSVGVGAPDSPRIDFVPESDSEDDVAAHRVDESVDKGLVEETQVFGDDDVSGVLGNSTVLADSASEQVITGHF